MHVCARIFLAPPSTAQVRLAAAIQLGALSPFMREHAERKREIDMKSSLGMRSRLIDSLISATTKDAFLLLIFNFPSRGMRNILTRSIKLDGNCG